MPLKLYDVDDFTTSWNKRDYLGGGAFGAVRKCENKQLGPVAIKCFLTTGSDNSIEAAHERLLREPKLLSRIQHPNIVYLHGIVKWNNCVGVVMELVEGRSMQDLVKSQRVEKISWNLRLRIAKELSDALGYLHRYSASVSFVHGDLKPENVLLTIDLHVKLADFGSSNVVRAASAAPISLDINTSTQHTILYAAPEVMKKPDTKRHTSMDVYSFAMVLYELVTRSAIFDGSAVPRQRLPFLIISYGTRPDSAPIERLKNEIIGSEDRDVIMLLEEIIKLCWKNEPEKRPEISEVRNRLAASLQTKDQRQIAVEAGEVCCLFLSSDDCQNHVLEPMVTLSRFSHPFMEVEQPPVYVADSQTVEVSKEKTLIVVLGGWKTLSDVLQYDPSTNAFTELPNLQVGRMHLAAATVGRQIFAMGGKTDANAATNCVERLDLDDPECSWITVNPMLEKRYHAAAATWKGVVYVCGGWNEKSECLSSIECYQPDSGAWTFIRSMRSAREGHSVAVDQGMLYIAGGNDGYNKLRTFERFDTETGQSRELPDMSRVFMHHAAAQLNGYIYLMGGIDDSLTFMGQTVRYSLHDNRWSNDSVSSMQKNRVSFGCCVVAGKLYAVGGRSYGDSMTTIERYNDEENQWEVVANLKKEWYRHAIVAI